MYRCYEEMTEDDVKRNELVWDDSEFGCGKGKLMSPLPGLIADV